MTGVQVCVYLQNEDEVVDGFSALVNVVLWRAFVALVEFEVLDDVGVSEDPQQDFLCDLEWAEQADLWGGGQVTQRGGVKNTQQTWLQAVSRQRRSHPWPGNGEPPA